MIETVNTIEYTWELAGSQGASFVLFPDKNHTEEQIRDAKSALRQQRDVVSIRLATREDRLYQYWGAIFKEAEKQGMKSSDIDYNHKLISKSFGYTGSPMSPSDYVTKYLSPNNIQK
jgi:hypothetical protein